MKRHAWSDSFFPAKILIFVVVAALLTGLPALASERTMEECPEIVGSVKKVTGKAFLGRGEERVAAHIGDHLFGGDVLITSAKSSMGVIFRDDTIISLGSNSEVRIDDFVFRPAEGRMNFLVNVGKGTAQFISGQMAKLSPESVQVETPLSTIGIRGTRFLVKVD